MLPPGLAPSLISLFSYLGLLTSSPAQLSPSLCVENSANLPQLLQCLDRFTVPHNYYTEETYTIAQPSNIQRVEWSQAISALLSVDRNCTAVKLGDSIEAYYSVSLFRERTPSLSTPGSRPRTFCVLHEARLDPCGRNTYNKGWGTFVVPAARSRRVGALDTVHISAPHPKYDLGTVEQAAAVFSGASARSLLVPGRTRTAFLQKSGCISGSVKRNGGQVYWMTDPAHNDLEPFFDASLAIFTHQTCHSPPSDLYSRCTFLQLHGKSPTTCAGDSVFISAGVSNSSLPSSKYDSWYTSPSSTYTSPLLLSHSLALPESFPSSEGYTVSLPSTSKCILTATRNVVGRLVNGIPRDEVCVRGADVESVRGDFVHVEQAKEVRSEWEKWVVGMQGAFGGEESVASVRESEPTSHQRRCMLLNMLMWVANEQ